MEPIVDIIKDIFLAAVDKVVLIGKSNSTFLRYVMYYLIFLVVYNIIFNSIFRKTDSYRYDFIKAHKGKRRIGKKGMWYRCACCGKWCGRPGKDKNFKIYDCDKMEVDHIRPWYKGGSDRIWNLQALCHDCNRKKSDKVTFKDRIKILKNDIVHLDFVFSLFRRKGRQNKILKGLGITKRKGY